ncbi:MAG: phosphomannomutase/phosphoglucomutase, partial [Acidimicrobiia bacterium]
LLRVITESGRPLSELRRDVERYAASGEINLRVEHHEAALSAVIDAFDVHDIDRVDGLTVDLGDSWFNLRPSNTEPYLRLNVEAPDEAGVDSLVGRIRGIVLPS